MRVARQHTYGALLIIMAEDSLFYRDREHEYKVLERAKAVNANRTVAIKVKGCTVYVTPEQAADENYMARLRQTYANTNIYW